ncbi:UNVERIFIED_CONTAM: hypothetical protein GTU68_052827 [Idotea baltica]|nr:hypothetical protein [Idotea baltica]
MKKVRVIGAGLAGSEAAWQLAKRSIEVELIEMRPKISTKAHKTSLCAELVCSNSFRGAAMSNAVGLLKRELYTLDSLIMEAAYASEVPAGGALAVDRERFSQYVDNAIKTHPLITYCTEELIEVPPSSADEPVIIATGPLTSRTLALAIENFLGADSLAFFDAISPILHVESLDLDKCWRQSRYDKGGDDYLNVAFSEEQYYSFIESVLAAEKYTGNEEVENDSLDKLRPFEGCMPIEDVIERGPETLRFGAFKPVGLTEPKTGKSPHAVMQLRQDDKAGTLWSMVGMQTRMKRHEQERIFKTLPGLENAEFLRYGTVHRNTFIDSPKCLNASLECRQQSGLFFAGQVTGTEGYVESTAGGLVAGINAARVINGEQAFSFPTHTAIGALLRYISEPGRKEFQPMNISFGLIESYEGSKDKRQGRKRRSRKERREAVSEAALDTISELKTQISSDILLAVENAGE